MATENGSYITRSELAAHIRRIDESLDNIKSDMSEIKNSIGSAPRWISGRVTRIFDYGLPVLMVAAATYLLTHI